MSSGTVIPNILIDSTRLRADVERLASTHPARCYPNIASLNSAAGYIHSRFQELGLPASYQAFKVGNDEFRNVIASYGPADGARIVVGAHYDVCGDQPGADDNASGVAGLLELARLLSLLRPPLKHRVDLVAYTLEEPPFYATTNMGSYMHARSLADSSVPLVAMISLEMLGYYSDAPGSQRFPLFLLKLFYPTRGNFILVTGTDGRLLKSLKSRINEASGVPAHSFKRRIGLSDHISYWAFGYPAVMVTNTAFYRNDNYHTAGDTPETLDYARMAEVVRGIYWAVVNLE